MIRIDKLFYINKWMILMSNWCKSHSKLRIQLSLLGMFMSISILKQIILIVPIIKINLIAAMNSRMIIKSFLLLLIQAQTNIIFEPDPEKLQLINIIQMTNSYVSNLFRGFVLDYKAVGLGLLLQGQTLKLLEDLRLFLGGGGHWVGTLLCA